MSQTPIQTKIEHKPSLQEQKEPIEIYILMIGRGEGLDLIWSWWGHTAVLVHDRQRDIDLIFDYGVFEGFGPFFLFHYLRGLPVFILGVSSLEETLAKYRLENRKVYAQRLLGGTEALAAFYQNLLINAHPQNRNYIYNHFYNNCTTKIRDLLNDFFVNDFKETYERKYAKEGLLGRAVNPAFAWPPVHLALNSVLGYKISKPHNLWENMFLPEDLIQALEDYRHTLPLAAKQSIGPIQLLQTNREDEIQKPNAFLQWSIFISLVLLFMFIFYIYPLLFHHHKIARWLGLVGWWIWYVPMGLFGFILAYINGNDVSAPFAYSIVGYNFMLHAVPPLFIFMPVAWFFLRRKEKRKKIWLGVHRFFVWWAGLGLLISLFLTNYVLFFLVLSFCVQKVISMQVNKGCI